MGAVGIRFCHTLTLQFILLDHFAHPVDGLRREKYCLSYMIFQEGTLALYV